MPLSAALGTAKALAPTLVDIPALSDIDMENPDVPKMSETERMMWVVLKCGEILDKTGKFKIAAAFKQLLDPKVIGMVVAGLIVWGASHFVGVGFILDIAAVVVMGLAVLKALEVMWDIYKIISGTSTKYDLERAAKMMADMVIDLGVETFLAIVLKGAAKSRFRAPPNKAAGSSGGGSQSAVATPPPKKAKSDGKPKANESEQGNKLAHTKAPKKDVECFNKPKGMNEKDFMNQLKEQEAAINKMDAQTMIDRRKAISDAGGTKKLRDSKAQEPARKLYKKTRTTELARKRIFGDKAKAIIAEEMSNLDATHTLDIIAGGDPSDISGLQPKGPNRSLGSQWRGRRSKSLEEYAKKLKESGMGKVKMLVNLSRC